MKKEKKYAFSNRLLLLFLVIFGILIIEFGLNNDELLIDENQITGLQTRDFRNALRPVGDLSQALVYFYENNLLAVEFIIYLLIFLGISVFVLGKKFGEKGTAAVAIGVSLALSFSLIRFRPGLTQELGPIAFLIIAAIIVGGLFAGLRKFDVDAKKALAVSFLAAVLLISIFIPTVVDYLQQSSLGALVWAIIVILAIISLIAIIKWAVIDTFRGGGGRGAMGIEKGPKEPGLIRSWWGGKKADIKSSWEEKRARKKSEHEEREKGIKNVEEKEIGAIEQTTRRELGFLTNIINKIEKLKADVSEDMITNVQKREVDIISSMVEDEMALSQNENARLSRLMTITKDKALNDEIKSIMAINSSFYNILKNDVREHLIIAKYPKAKGGRINNLNNAEKAAMKAFDIKKTQLSYSQRLIKELSTI